MFDRRYGRFVTTPHVYFVITVTVGPFACVPAWAGPLYKEGDIYIYNLSEISRTVQKIDVLRYRRLRVVGANILTPYILEQFRLFFSGCGDVFLLFCFRFCCCINSCCLGVVCEAPFLFPSPPPPPPPFHTYSTCSFKHIQRLVVLFCVKLG